MSRLGHLVLTTDPRSAPVTQWTSRLLLVLVVLGVIVGATWLMWLGWRHRARRQADLPALPVPPADLGADLIGPLEGRYLGTTTAGDWLDRVVVHGLGVPSRCGVRVTTAGVQLERVGAPDVFIPSAQLSAARLDKGIAGQVYEDGGVLVLTWLLGSRTLDSGLRLSGPDHHLAVVEAVGRLADARTPGGSA